MHNKHVKSQDGNGKHQILDIDRHQKMNLASNDAIAAVAQAQQFVLMQRLLHVHQLSILQYFMLQQLPHDDQLLQLSTQKPHVTFCIKNTYFNPYYCLSRTILLPNSYQYYCLVMKIFLVFDVFAYWKVLKCVS